MTPIIEAFNRPLKLDRSIANFEDEEQVILQTGFFIMMPIKPNQTYEEYWNSSREERADNSYIHIHSEQEGILRFSNKVENPEKFTKLVNYSILGSSKFCFLPTGEEKVLSEKVNE